MLNTFKTILLFYSITAFSASALEAGQNYGDWSVNCGNSQEGVEICALEQELKDDNDQAVARISIVRSQNSDIIASVKVPLLVNLQAGLGLGVDGNLVSTTKFFSCDAEGCMSLIKLDEEKQNRLKKGKKLNIGVYLADQEVNVTASLMGITRGLNNL